MKNIAAILFDKDGTLYHYGDTWSVWCERVLTELSNGDVKLAQQMGSAVGFDFSSGVFAPGSLVVGGAADEVNDIWRDFVPDYSAEGINDVAIRHLSDLPQKPVCDLHALFTSLREKGFLLGIATNDFEAGATQQLAKSGITDLFDFVAGFDSGFGSKPEAGMILGFAKRLNLETDQIAMVGDSTHDLSAGRAGNVGLNIGVLTGPAVTGDLDAMADFILPSIAELPTVL
jgi:phosphoglycolate phosphatase